MDLKVKVLVSQLCLTRQSPLFMGLSKQEYWSGLPFPSPGDLPDPGIEPRSPELQVDTLLSESPGKPQYVLTYLKQKTWVRLGRTEGW